MTTIEALGPQVRPKDVVEFMAGTAKWSPYPPVPLLTNVCASRGHIVDQLGDCAQCEQLRPARGGFSRACPNDRRVFQGG
jgi:hypothetical protein